MPHAPRFVIGDVHGQMDALAWLLTSSGLAADGLRWTGADATLWFIGDYVDRGPEGVAVLDLIMRLQGEAAGAGGRVGALMGNHEAMLVSAVRVGGVRAGPEGTFADYWRINGGVASDLANLTAGHVAWIERLPVLAIDGEVLLLHADSGMYLTYGDSIDSVNAAIQDILRCDDADRWNRLLDAFADRLAFVEDAGLAKRLLATYGGSMLVHGHTPIWLATGLPAARITRPLVYAGGLCVNVDAGLYSGSPGFVYEMPR